MPDFVSPKKMKKNKKKIYEGIGMGRSLARCLFQKGGEFRPTKGKRKRKWPVCNFQKENGPGPFSIPPSSQNSRFNLNE